MNPIRGLRYKCSVCKNFDYCAKCEERLDHGHSFLKICVPGGAPEVMITMLNEEPASAQEESKGGPENLQNFFQQMMGQFGQRGGRGGRGGRGCHGRGGGFRHIMQQFLNNCGNWSSDEFKDKMEQCGKDWKNFAGKKDWKEARAVCVRKPEHVIELAPGMTDMAEIEVLNDTFWPWKQGCTLTLADE